MLVHATRRADAQTRVVKSVLERLICTPGVNLLSECVSSTPPSAAMVQHFIKLAVKAQLPVDPSTATLVSLV